MTSNYDLCHLVFLITNIIVFLLYVVVLFLYVVVLFLKVLVLVTNGVKFTKLIEEHIIL